MQRSTLSPKPGQRLQGSRAGAKQPQNENRRLVQDDQWIAHPETAFTPPEAPPNHDLPPEVQNDLNRRKPRK